MEQPTTDFVDIVIILAREDRLKEKEKNDDNNNNSTVESITKQRFKDCLESAPKQVVSWLLYLIVNGTCKNIKEKSVQLLNKLLIKKGDDLLKELLLEDIMEAIKFETVELLKTNLSVSFIGHLFGIIEKIALFLIPRGLWNELQPSLVEIVNREEEEEEGSSSPLKENALSLLSLLSKYDFKKSKLDTLVNEISSGELSDDQYRSLLPDLLSTLPIIEKTEGEYFKKIVVALNNIYMDENPNWMQEFILPIIDTLIEVLDINRENGFSSSNKSQTNTKGVVYKFLLDMVENDENNIFEPYAFTNSHLERILSHLYEWMIQVEDVSVEEWTDSDYCTDNQGIIFNINSEEEGDLGILKTDFDQQIPADSNFERFVGLIGNHVEIQQSIYNQFTSLVNSQKWNERYASLIALSKFTRFLIDIVTQQHPFILNSIFKLVEDENIRVRWASLQCLIQLFIHTQEMIGSKEKVYQVLIKSIYDDPNERIQISCCLLLQTMTNVLEADMIADTDLQVLSSLFEKLLQSQKLYVVESALPSLMSLASIAKERLKPYFGNIIPILLSVLEKHQSIATKESRVLRCRSVKAFALCGLVVDNNTFSTYLNKFMVMFVKKNQGSVDLSVDITRASYSFIQTVGNEFAVYLPMTVRMAVNVLEIPLPDQEQDMRALSRQNVKKIMSTLTGMNNLIQICMPSQSTLFGDVVYQQLAPFIHCLIGPLIKLVGCTVNNRIQLFSLDNLPKYVTMYKMHYGAGSDKTIEMFGMVVDLVATPSMLETDWNLVDQRVLVSHRVFAATNLIKLMDSSAGDRNEMSLDQIQSTVALFYNLDKRIQDFVEQQANIGNTDLIGVGLIVVRNYEMLVQLIEYNSSITIPLITQDLLIRGCHKLRDNEGSNAIKALILTFMHSYCKYGGELAISSFPHIIPAIIECLTYTNNISRIAASTLKEAAQNAKDRFSPWAIDALLGLDAIVSAASLMMVPRTSSSDVIISSINTIIQYVPKQLTSNININVSDIIQKCLNHLDKVSKLKKNQQAQLLDKLFIKKPLIRSLPKEILDAVKFETVELLKTNITIGYTYNYIGHLLGIILALILIPRVEDDGSFKVLTDKVYYIDNNNNPDYFNEEQDTNNAQTDDDHHAGYFDFFKSTDQIFKVIGKYIRDDPNERIQSSCCQLVQTMMSSLKIDTLSDNVLEVLSSSFEILLQSPNLNVVKHALLSLNSVVFIFKEKLKPVISSGHEVRNKSSIIPIISRVFSLFTPWIIEALQAFDIMVSMPLSDSDDDDAKMVIEKAVSMIDTPNRQSIPTFEHLQSKRERVALTNLNINQRYFTIKLDNQDLDLLYLKCHFIDFLDETCLFIKELLQQSNKDSVPTET
ncbi:hypothetical protein DFA_00494 [Cavenderia fasciculata]|uniref:HEAT repeat-containing protein n=1 Tax=Cavenderia fasciculata TaxID=261658 RepID=F4PS35_CACFS|nr:uncharacterized protein DFA_00494 [Cavenderia fasciculata]EGG20633.1 hypothetical protein DFA_00494 [Cavenderia fasciculata]|eukprot:XP_004358483.1 hypothetical protein DFA_00494 [Cavenderia fasciculata]